MTLQIFKLLEMQYSILKVLLKILNVRRSTLTKSGTKVHFKMRCTNCKICEYSLNIRNIVDFLPEIPSGIRKLNFQS